jgi:hypothetical protein
MAMTMEERLTAAIASMVTFYAEERWQRWAKLWLSERDRSAGSAHAMQEYLRDLAGDPDSARTLFTRASIGVAQTLASLAGTLAQRKEISQDVEELGDTIDKTQRYIFALIKAAIGPTPPST